MPGGRPLKRRPNGPPTLEWIRSCCVETPSGCWLWQGATTHNGYGQVNVGGARLVHRVAYELAVGPIPEGLDVDHQCHNADASCPGGVTCEHRRCCNPAHLAPVTRSANLRAGRKAGVDRCPAGHPYEGDNLVIEQRGGGHTSRRCRTCKRARGRRRERPSRARR